jgi:transcriptional regulator with XRE-family HTH domain
MTKTLDESAGYGHPSDNQFETRRGGDVGPMPSETLGGRIRELREKAGLSRETLASRGGLSWAAIQQLETGRRAHPRPATLAALATGLGVSVDHLLGRTQDTSLRHEVLVYSGREHLAEVVGAYVSEGARLSEPALIATTDENIEALRDRIESTADVRYVESRSWYRDPTSALRSFRAFTDERVSAGARRTRIVGEPVWGGRSKQEADSWSRADSLLNLSWTGRPVTVLCAYDERTLPETILKSALETHPYSRTAAGVTPNETFVDPEEYVLRRR